MDGSKDLINYICLPRQEILFEVRDGVLKAILAVEIAESSPG
jgi:hypothetical protein